MGKRGCCFPHQTGYRHLNPPQCFFAALSLGAFADRDVEHMAPMFASASDSVRQGFVRVINHSRRAREVRIDARDDNPNPTVIMDLG